MKKAIYFVFLFLIACFICSPFLFLLSGSIMSDYELQRNFAPIILENEKFIHWSMIPDYPTLMHYVKLLFYTPSFYIVFWNSIKIVFCILFGQLCIGVPAAWALAVCNFRGKKALFTLYVVLMLMPFQVTMLSQYLVLQNLQMINTHQAIILPAIFSTFPIFIIYRGFCNVPVSLMEAAKIDGAGEWIIFCKIGIPLASGGILSAMVLGFLEYWSLIEQPLAFLQDKSLWPLSLYLPEIGFQEAGYAFVASLITLIPAVFVFLLGQDYLERGIVASGLKE